VGLFGRRERPPRELLELLDRDERVVAWGTSTGTSTASGAAHVLATPRGLWWPSPEGQRLIGWHRIDKATWRDGVLTVTEADVLDDLLLVDRAAVSIELDEPRHLPATVRQRVDANVVHTELLPVPGGAARVVARRIPGRDGLVWWARLEDGARDSEETRVAVRRQIERVQTRSVPVAVGPAAPVAGDGGLQPGGDGAAGA
jgi:hypothetical protein